MTQEEFIFKGTPNTLEHVDGKISYHAKDDLIDKIEVDSFIMSSNTEDGTGRPLPSCVIWDVGGERGRKES